MLKQRVITAVLLLAVLLPALFAAPVWPFAVLTLVAVAAAGWEWGRLNGLASAPAIGMGAGVAVICLLSWPALASLQAPTLWWIATVAWVLGGAWLLRLGPTQWPRLPQALRLLLGVGILWLTWLALTQSKAIGLNFLLSVFCLVWAADIAAYFGGRAFGKRKLAPAISPGKSWEGVWHGRRAAAGRAVDRRRRALGLRQREPVHRHPRQLRLGRGGGGLRFPGGNERGRRPVRILDQT
jgi:phosphatidate cytidylyltransferase